MDNSNIDANEDKNQVMIYDLFNFSAPTCISIKNRGTFGSVLGDIQIFANVSYTFQKKNEWNYVWQMFALTCMQTHFCDDSFIMK